MPFFEHFTRILVHVVCSLLWTVVNEFISVLVRCVCMDIDFPPGYALRYPASKIWLNQNILEFRFFT